MRIGRSNHPFDVCRRLSDSRRNGSILMETILVLPLFLMLLGGMFVLGDLMMGRLLQLDADRVVAWRAVDRFVPDSELHPDMSIPDAFDRDIGRDGVDKKPGFVAYNDDHETPHVGNVWTEFMSGRSEVIVDVPWWTAYLDVQNVMVGDKDRFQSSFKLDSDNGEFVERPRSYVLRRRDSSQNWVRARMADAEDLVERFWIGIVFDPMAGTAVRTVESKPIPAPSSTKLAYNRIPHAIVASGDPGP